MRLAPASAGTFGFACGMNMVHGTLVVEPAGDSSRGRRWTRSRPPAAMTPPSLRPPATSRQRRDEDTEAAERRAEIADLTRRVIVGAVLTVPVLFAVMAHDVFGATWVPACC